MVQQSRCRSKLQGLDSDNFPREFDFACELSLFFCSDGEFTHNASKCEWMFRQFSKEIPPLKNAVKTLKGRDFL